MTFAIFNLSGIIPVVKDKSYNFYKCSLIVSVGSFNIFTGTLFIHPVQVPRWLRGLIILLKVPPRSQIMSPWPINEKVFYPGHKETLPQVIF